MSQSVPSGAEHAAHVVEQLGERLDEVVHARLEAELPVDAVVAQRPVRRARDDGLRDPVGQGAQDAVGVALDERRPRGGQVAIVDTVAMLADGERRGRHGPESRETGGEPNFSVALRLAHQGEPVASLWSAGKSGRPAYVPQPIGAPVLKTVTQSLVHNFLGGSPRWYKVAIIAFLVVNPIVLLRDQSVRRRLAAGGGVHLHSRDGAEVLPAAAGWSARDRGDRDRDGLPDAVFEETKSNFTVILLLMFMVAGIYFMRELLLLLFTKLLVAHPLEDPALADLRRPRRHPVGIPRRPDGRGRRDRGRNRPLRGLPPVRVGARFRRRPRS